MHQIYIPLTCNMRRRTYGRIQRKWDVLVGIFFLSLLTVFTPQQVQNKTYTYVSLGEGNRTISELGAIRTVTAYNVGIAAQTDDTPCIGATGEDLCKALERGERVCAANFVPLGTVLTVKGYGDCMVKDRMARRYSDRVDIAMKASEYEQALKWGAQKLRVYE